MLGRIASVLRSAFAEIDARDGVLAAGLVLLSAGLYQVWIPGAFIAPGVVLTYVAVFSGPRGSA
jgi:hypothetical protein